jgi:putative ABC transport system substrate-binding protein
MKGGPYWQAFVEGLRERGYLQGQNLVIECRWMEGQEERAPALATELLALKPDLLVANTGSGVRAAKQATSTIPIVLVNVNNPVGQGLVASLAHPGGNITGVASTPSMTMGGKQFQLLKEAAPKVSRVAVLRYSRPGGSPGLWREEEEPARALGLTLQLYGVRAPEELEGAFTAMTKARAEALLVEDFAFVWAHAHRIVELSAKSRLPDMYPGRPFVEAGGLMAYAVNLPDIFRHLGFYVDKILKGANPADLPVEQPTKFELLINLKTAKALGLTIPQSLLNRADEVIQ